MFLLLNFEKSFVTFKSLITSYISLCHLIAAINPLNDNHSFTPLPPYGTHYLRISKLGVYSRLLILFEAEVLI